MNVPTSIDKCEMVALVLCTCNLNLIISAVAGLSICTYGGVYEVNKHGQQLPTQHTNEYRTSTSITEHITSRGELCGKILFACFSL